MCINRHRRETYMENIIIIIIVVGLVGASSFYIYKKKKAGVKCIGCPNSGSCPKCNCKGNNQ